MYTKREYMAALAEAKALADIDRRDLTKEQITHRNSLYERIAEYERKKS